MIQLAHRIVLTEKCNGTCPHCFNARFRKTAEMDVDKLIEFWKLNYPSTQEKRLKVMGGEPTLHPRIMDVMHEGCLYFGGVDLFTNGTRMSKIANDPLVLKYHMSGQVQYIINGYAFDFNDLKESLPFLTKVILHFVIPDNEKEVDEICEKILKSLELGGYTLFHIVISPDTQVNLFDDEIQEKYRKLWMKAITKLVPILIDRGVGFNYDHVLPMCFYTQEMLDELHTIPVHNDNKYLDSVHSMKITCCCEVQMGLILPNFDLYFCNQTRIKLGSILRDNGQPKTMEEILEMIQPFSETKTKCIKELSPKCAACPVVASCKLGCYYTTLLRSQNEK